MRLVHFIKTRLGRRVVALVVAASVLGLLGSTLPALVPSSSNAPGVVSSVTAALVPQAEASTNLSCNGTDSYRSHYLRWNGHYTQAASQHLNVGNGLITGQTVNLTNSKIRMKVELYRQTGEHTWSRISHDGYGNYSSYAGCVRSAGNGNYKLVSKARLKYDGKVRTFSWKRTWIVNSN